MIILQILLSALFINSTSASELSIVSEKPLSIGVLQSALDEQGVEVEALVSAGALPSGTRLEFIDKQPHLTKYILVKQGKEKKLKTQVKLIFWMKVVSLPEKTTVSEKRRLLGSSVYVALKDIRTPTLVKQLYSEKIPAGGKKVSYRLPWDYYNPTGLWSYTVQESLRTQENFHLVQSTPADVVDFCPSYFSLRDDKKEIFWIALVSQIAALESSFNPLTASDEGRFNVNSVGIFSSGLTQISIGSSKHACYQARGCNNVQDQSDLFNPSKELKCTVAVMSCLVEMGSCLSCQDPVDQRWRGVAAYWSTMRSPYTVDCPTCKGGKATIGKKAKVQEMMRKAAPFCYVGAR